MPEPTPQDWQAAREYLFGGSALLKTLFRRTVPGEHRAQDVAVWEDAVARCAAATARLRVAAGRRGQLLEKDPGC